jgi:flavin reductase (DIM6/NTAB) family NADH-FMN oxidoreductase RutF
VKTDSTVLRQAFGAFATGVTVVTVGGKRPHGMTANSFTTVSLDPPLVLVCVDRSAVMHASLTSTGRFGVSVLASDQEHVAKHFANPRRPLGSAQFEVADWHPGLRTGVPLLSGALAVFECDVWRRYEGGDHSIIVGRLLSTERSVDDDALLFCHGKFCCIESRHSGVTA